MNKSELVFESEGTSEPVPNGVQPLKFNNDAQKSFPSSLNSVQPVKKVEMSENKEATIEKKDTIVSIDDGSVKYTLTPSNCQGNFSQGTF